MLWLGRGDIRYQTWWHLLNILQEKQQKKDLDTILNEKEPLKKQEVAAEIDICNWTRGIQEQFVSFKTFKV